MSWFTYIQVKMDSLETNKGITITDKCVVKHSIILNIFSNFHDFNWSGFQMRWWCDDDALWFLLVMIVILVKIASGTNWLNMIPNSTSLSSLVPNSNNYSLYLWNIVVAIEVNFNVCYYYTIEAINLLPSQQQRLFIDQLDFHFL